MLAAGKIRFALTQSECSSIAVEALILFMYFCFSWEYDEYLSIQISYLPEGNLLFHYLEWSNGFRVFGVRSQNVGSVFSFRKLAY